MTTSKQVKIRRGSTVEVDNFTPAVAEIISDTESNELVHGNGVNEGGTRIQNKGELKTLSQLILDKTPRIGQVLRTSGYAQPDDGGHGDYVIVAAATGTADGGLYIDLTGSGLQAKLVHNGEVSAKQYGAKADGVTSDTLTLQALFDSGVKNIHLNPGTYKLTAGLKLGDVAGYTDRMTDDPTATSVSNVTIRGAGNRATILDGSEIDSTVLTLYKCTACTIAGIDFKGNPSYTTEDLFRSSGLELIDCLDCSILDNAVFDVGSINGFISGIYLSSCLSCRVEGNNLRNNNNGINLDNFYTAKSIHTGQTANSKNNIITENKLFGTVKTAIVLDGAFVSKNVVSNNIIEGSGANGCISLQSSFSNVISDNLITNANTHGIQCSSNAGNVTLANSFTGNVIRDITAANGFYIPTDNNGGSFHKNYVITDNTLVNIDGRGVYAEGLVETTVSSNNIENCTLSAIQFEPNAAAGALGSLIVQGNVIRDSFQEGIKVYAPLACTFQNNIIQNVGKEDTIYSCITVSGGNVTYNHFAGNSLLNTSTPGFRAAYGFDFSAAGTITDNVFTDVVSLNLINGLFESISGTFQYDNILRNVIDNGTLSYTIRTGGFSPEGNVTGVPGDLWMNPNGGAGNTLWVKETGTGNTGWAAK